MRLVAFGLMILLSVSSICQPRSHSSPPQDSGFAFYLLRGTTFAISRALSMPIDSLGLDSIPLFTGQHIKSYSWSTHTFVLKSKADSIFKRMCTLGSRGGGDIPFIITVNNERIYLGEFSSPLSSFSPHCAFIGIGRPSPYRIYHPRLMPQPDKRSDKRIHDALKAAGVLIE